MKFIASVGAAVALCAAALPAHAATLIFNANHANIDGPVSTSGTSTGLFTDTYSFTTEALMAVSGSLTTHSLTDLSGNVVEDMDFLSVTLDGLAFANNSTSDANEEYSLASSALAAGAHTLTVTYRIDTASPQHAAAYSGDMYLAPSSVPEPAAWAMFLAGFGLIGASLRGRKQPSPLGIQPLR